MLCLYEDRYIKHFNIVIENVCKVNIIYLLNDHKGPPNSHNNTKQLDDGLFSQRKRLQFKSTFQKLYSTKSECSL